MISIFGVAAFLIWQWYLSLQDGDKYDRDKTQKLADKMGREAESLQIGARPRLASDEPYGLVSGILTQMQGLWSRLLPDGNGERPDDKTWVKPPAKDPLIYGYR